MSVSFILNVSARSQVSDEPAHPRSLVRSFAARMQKICRLLKDQAANYVSRPTSITVQTCLKSKYSHMSRVFELFTGEFPTRRCLSTARPITRAVRLCQGT